MYLGGLSLRRFLSSKSLYDVLNVPKDASGSEIKKAFFEIAKKYHPDTNKDPDAPKKFIEAKRAYDTLSDAEKRRVYDSTGVEEQPDMGAAQESASTYDFKFRDFYNNFTNFDFFNDLFHDNQSRDIEVSISLDFLEACIGAHKSLKVERLVPCKPCGGRGFTSSIRTSCPKCKGTGNITDIKGGFIFSQPCRTCQGTGRSPKDACSSCSGSSFTKEHSTVEVDFPSGIGNDLIFRT